MGCCVATRASRIVLVGMHKVGTKRRSARITSDKRPRWIEEGKLAMFTFPSKALVG